MWLTAYCPHASSLTNASEWRRIDPRFDPSLPVSHICPFFHPSLLLFHADLRSAPLSLTSFSFGSLHTSATPPSNHWCHSQNSQSKCKWSLWKLRWEQSIFTFSPFSVQFKVTLSSVAVRPVSFPSLLEWYFGDPPTSFLMLYYLHYLPCLGGAFTPSTSRFPSPMDAWSPLTPFFF